MSLRTKYGVALGRLDEKGRLVYRAGRFFPSRDPDLLDRVLREGVEEIVEDGGRLYRTKAVKVLRPWLEFGL